MYFIALAVAHRSGHAKAYVSATLPATLVNFVMLWLLTTQPRERMARTRQVGRAGAPACIAAC
jgi:hypothetical protein